MHEPRFPKPPSLYNVREHYANHPREWADYLVDSLYLQSPSIVTPYGTIDNPLRYRKCCNIAMKAVIVIAGIAIGLGIGLLI